MSDTFTAQEWIDTKPTDFDHTEAFRDHIEPLMDQLVAACREHDIALAIHITYSAQGRQSTEAAAGHFPNKVSEIRPSVLIAARIPEGPHAVMATLMACSEWAQAHTE